MNKLEMGNISGICKVGYKQLLLKIKWKKTTKSNNIVH